MFITPLRIRLAFEEKKDTRQLKSSKGENNVPKELSNALSPNQKHRLIVTKHAIGEENASTQVSLNTPDGGAGVYGVKGVDLAVKAYWKDNDTIIIETKKDYQVQSRACRQLQIFNNIFSFALIES